MDIFINFHYGFILNIIHSPLFLTKINISWDNRKINWWLIDNYYSLEIGIHRGIDTWLHHLSVFFPELKDNFLGGNLCHGMGITISTSSISYDKWQHFQTNTNIMT